MKPPKIYDWNRDQGDFWNQWDTYEKRVKNTHKVVIEHDYSCEGEDTRERIRATLYGTKPTEDVCYSISYFAIEAFDGGRGMVHSLYFKNKNDALMFKLKWMK